MKRKIGALAVGLLIAAFWSAFMFMLAAPQIFAPPDYYSDNIQRNADMMRLGYLALMGVLYVAALGHASWMTKMIWKGEI